MPELVIADASCLIVLDKIQHLELLHELYTDVCTTPTVAYEFGLPLPSWLPVRTPKQPDLLASEYGGWVTDGELTAITLALEEPESRLILDDKKARLLAQRFNLRLTGTLGVLLLAKTRGLVPAIRPLLLRLQQEGFRLSSRLIEQTLRAADEMP